MTAWGHSVGQRPLLVITPMIRWTSAALPGELADLFAIHLMELPGPGSASSPHGASTVPAITAAVREVAQDLGPSTVLFGHSMNGALAMASAAEATCAGVIAVTPPVSLPPDPAAAVAYWEAHAEPDRRHRAAELVAAYEASSDGVTRANLQAEFNSLRRWHDPDVDRNELDSLVALDDAWIASVFESGRSVDWPGRFRRLQPPVLLALGDYDFVAPPDAWTDDLLPPAATVVHFRNSSHTPYVEEPAAFLENVERWVGTLADA